MADSEIVTTQVELICPQCEKRIPVPVKVWIKDAEFSYLGMAELCTEPDTEELWAHTFTHQIDQENFD